MHEIIDKKFYLGPKFGTLINKKWITNSELLHCSTENSFRTATPPNLTSLKLEDSLGTKMK
jgi:hypothetical protein